MDILAFLRESTGRFGPAGYEQEMAKWLKAKFEPLCDEVFIDPMSNVIAIKKPTAESAGRIPRIMVCAHMDEIALLVTEILKDGSLRINKLGGVSPPTLPAATVTVHTEEGELFGVIGAKPPHLLTEEDRKQAVTFEDLYVDLGLDPETVKAKVNIGDVVTLQGAPLELLNDRVAGKTMDDRCCVAVMLDAAERLQKTRHAAEVVFCCSAQEEVGGNGSHVAAYTAAPDIGFVLDVTHASFPGARPNTTVPPDAPAAAFGPYIQHKLFQKLRDVAKENGIKLSVEISERSTYTDTDDIQIAREGVPCVLVGVPLNYMHTSVELGDAKTMAECGRLTAAFAAAIEEGWDQELWT